jgi:hypothetical protein
VNFLKVSVILCPNKKVQQEKIAIAKNTELKSESIVIAPNK